MAGSLFPATRDTGITATSAGVVTVASTAAYRTGMYGYLEKTSQPGMVIRIEVASATQLKVRQILDPRGGGVGTTADDVAKANALNSGYTDVSAYNAGNIYAPDQFVYNPNDAPLT